MLALGEALGINGEYEVPLVRYVDLGVGDPAYHTPARLELIFTRRKTDGLEEARTRRSKRK